MKKSHTKNQKLNNQYSKHTEVVSKKTLQSKEVKELLKNLQPNIKKLSEYDKKR